ncbi:MAG: MFS transporter [Chloroflexi bacterium]|nr:MFS transporter [Chloroflexota bacterium]
MTTEEQRLSFWRKFGYAVGDFGNAVGAGTVIPFWYTLFLTDIARLDLGLVSLFWLVVTAWDAFNDPLFGFLSDRTRTRWGRRRPYILFGALPFGLAFALLWVVPPVARQGLLFAYYVLVYMVYESAFTAVSCPYSALTPELTEDHDERTSLVSYRMAVSIGAGLLAPVIIGLVIFPMFPERDPNAYRTIGLLCGASFVPPLWITFLATRERPEFGRARPLPLRDSLRFVARNYAFRYTLSLRILSWMPVVIAQAVFAYFLLYWVGMGEDQASIVQAVIMAAALLSLPAVLWLARRLEKKVAYIVAAATWTVVMLSILWVPAGAHTPAYVIAALAGFGVAAAHVLPSAMSPDVLEVDELMSGRRQEGAYAGVETFVQKLAQALVLAVLPLALRASGYVQPSPDTLTPTQPASALTVLRLLVSLLPAALLLASIAVAWFYPLTRQRYLEIQRRLRAQRSQPPA